jgi:hypothetical protein
MAPMIAAKNMAGKERVDSSMLPTCSLRASVHNAIVCANRKFCWQRLLYGKATAKGMEAAPRVGGVSKLYWRFFSALRRSEISSWARPSRRSLRILMDKAVAKCPPSAFRNNNRATPSPSKSRKKFWRWPLSTGKRGWCQASARRSTAAGRGASLSVTNGHPGNSCGSREFGIRDHSRASSAWRSAFNRDQDPYRYQARTAHRAFAAGSTSTRGSLQPAR